MIFQKLSKSIPHNYYNKLMNIISPKIFLRHIARKDLTGSSIGFIDLGEELEEGEFIIIRDEDIQLVSPLHTNEYVCEGICFCEKLDIEESNINLEVTDLVPSSDALRSFKKARRRLRGTCKEILSEKCKKGSVSSQLTHCRGIKDTCFGHPPVCFSHDHNRVKWVTLTDYCSIGYSEVYRYKNKLKDRVLKESFICVKYPSYSNGKKIFYKNCRLEDVLDVEDIQITKTGIQTHVQLNNRNIKI